MYNGILPTPLTSHEPTGSRRQGRAQQGSGMLLGATVLVRTGQMGYHLPAAWLLLPDLRPGRDVRAVLLGRRLRRPASIPAFTQPDVTLPSHTLCLIMMVRWA